MSLLLVSVLQNNHGRINPLFLFDLGVPAGDGGEIRCHRKFSPSRVDASSACFLSVSCPGLSCFLFFLGVECSGRSSWTRRWRRSILRLPTSSSSRRPASGRSLSSSAITAMFDYVVLWVLQDTIELRQSVWCRGWSSSRQRTSRRCQWCRRWDPSWRTSTARDTLARDTTVEMSTTLLLPCIFDCLG